MCGRYNFSKNSSSPMVQKVLENLQSRQIEVKTGDVNPGDVAAVIASNRKLEPQAFGMKWGYKLPDGKLIFNARSETAAQKAMFADGMRQRRCLIPADCYYEWQKKGKEKQKYQLAPTNANGFFLAGIYRIEQGECCIFRPYQRAGGFNCFYPSPNACHPSSGSYVRLVESQI